VAATVRITIDTRVYTLTFNGFDASLHAAAPSGACVELQPWPLGEHLAALDSCVLAGSEGLGLDAEQFASRVLAHSGVPPGMRQEFLPLALWWASGGGEADKMETNGDGVYVIGSHRLRLRPWTGGQRAAAVSRCQTEEGAGRLRFNLGAYLHAMLAASVIPLPPDDALERLDSGMGAALLQAVLRLNVVNPDEGEGSPLYAPDAARKTLRLCRELGWTPSQVWDTPAAELDRLELLLAQAYTEASVPGIPRRAALTDHPDTVVIRIEDD
jgi:hypothetical protein